MKKPLVNRNNQSLIAYVDHFAAPEVVVVDPRRVHADHVVELTDSGCFLPSQLFFFLFSYSTFANFLLSSEIKYLTFVHFLSYIRNTKDKNL